MANPELIKAYDCGAAVNPYRIVKFDAADRKVIQAAASTDLMIGVSDTLGGANGGRADIIRSGIADVEYGGDVTRGQKLTSDADGKAVAAAPAAGVNAEVIGEAEVSGVSGDIGSVYISPSTMQGA